MSWNAIVALAIGLAMDAAAVAAARGLATPIIRWQHVGLVALFFGGFQALMPFLGALLGARLGLLIQHWDHWIAFGLLLCIGLKMLKDAWEHEEAPFTPSSDNPFSLRILTILALATSVDALAVGITFPLLGVPVGRAVLVIGLVTALLSIGGLFAGRIFGALLGKRLDAVGGFVLIALGTRILIEHLQM